MQWKKIDEAFSLASLPAFSPASSPDFLPASFQVAELFLRKHENCCSAAISRYNECLSAERKAWLGFDKQGEVRAFLLFAPYGSLYPVFGKVGASGAGSDLKQLPPNPAGWKIRAIQGTLDDVDTVLRLHGHRARGKREVIDYSLMLLDSAPSAASLAAGPGSLRIRRADRQDAELLLPLRLAYEREEVLPPGAPANIPATRMSLEKSLADRLVLVAELDGEVVATAATNARAFTRDQIGGVYVVPALRDRGIGTRIVAELGALLREEHRSAVLFVKTSNIPAIRAYGRIGFLAGDPYRIVYFS